MDKTAQTSTLVMRRNDGLLAAAVGEELLMMSAAEGKYFNLNNVGARIWELLAQPASVESLVTALTDEYDVTADAAHAQVQDFLSALRERNLLVSADGTPLA